jgi:uncharacterized protein (TIGR02453 family)
MLQAHTLKFLKELQKNNNKPWFDLNRKNYETAKADFQQMVGFFITQIASFDANIGSLTTKDCTFRINRDVRFSKDKSPYKTNFAASFNKGGKKGATAGYYLHIQPGQNFIAGGYYMPMPPDLIKIRQEIDYSFNDWKKIIGNAAFKKHFPNGVDGIESLVRPPKGYDEKNPAIEYLKMKGFIVSAPITDADLMSKNFVKNTTNILKAIKPFINFLNHAIE